MTKSANVGNSLAGGGGGLLAQRPPTPKNLINTQIPPPLSADLTRSFTRIIQLVFVMQNSFYVAWPLFISANSFNNLLRWQGLRAKRVNCFWAYPFPSNYQRNSELGPPGHFLKPVYFEVQFSLLVVLWMGWSNPHDDKPSCSRS